VIGLSWSTHGQGGMANLSSREALIEWFEGLRFNSVDKRWWTNINVRETPAVVFDPGFERKIWDYFAPEIEARKQRVLFGQILLQTYGDPVP
jgi:hypothetical protein